MNYGIWPDGRYYTRTNACLVVSMDPPGIISIAPVNAIAPAIPAALTAAPILGRGVVRLGTLCDQPRAVRIFGHLFDGTEIAMATLAAPTLHADAVIHLALLDLDGVPTLRAHRYPWTMWIASMRGDCDAVEMRVGTRVAIPREGAADRKDGLPVAL